jgi:hypothetical protein
MLKCCWTSRSMLMIDVSGSLFTLIPELLARVPTPPDGDLPKGQKSLGFLPEDLRPAYSVLITATAELIALEEQTALNETSLQLPAGTNPSRAVRHLLENVAKFDQLDEMRTHARRLKAILQALIMPFFCEIERRFPDAHFSTIGVTRDWEIYDQSSSSSTLIAELRSFLKVRLA